MNFGKIGSLDKTLKALISTFLFLYGLSLVTSNGGMELFSWCTALMTILYIFKTKGKPIFPSKVWLICLALFLFTLMSLLQNEVPFNETLSILGKTRSLALLFLLSISTAVVSSKIPSFFPKLAIITCIVSLFSISQFFTGITHKGTSIYKIGEFYQSTGFLGHPLTFSHSLNMIILFFLGLYFLEENKKRKNLFLITFVVGSLAILTSLTRGAWLALIVAFFATLTLNQKTRKPLLLSIPFALCLTLFPFFRKHFTSIASFDYSNAVRLKIWQANWQMFIDHPFWGVGYSRNAALIDSYYDKLQISPPLLSGADAHNTFLHFLSGTGLPGAILYLALIIAVLTITIRGLRTSSSTQIKGIFLGALGAQIAFHIGSLTHNSFQDNEVNHSFICLCALVLSTHYLNSKSKNFKPNI